MEKGKFWVRKWAHTHSHLLFDIYVKNTHIHTERERERRSRELGIRYLGIGGMEGAFSLSAIIGPCTYMNYLY